MKNSFGGLIIHTANKRTMTLKMDRYKIPKLKYKWKIRIKQNKTTLEQFQYVTYTLRNYQEEEKKKKEQQQKKMKEMMRIYQM